MLRHAIGTALGKLGFRVEQAASSFEARQLASVAGRTLDAAVVDIGLPDRSGEELAGELRAIDPDLLIVVASGQAAYSRARFAADPNVAFLDKPYDADRLADLLRRRGVGPADARPRGSAASAGED